MTCHRGERTGEVQPVGLSDEQGAVMEAPALLRQKLSAAFACTAIRTVSCKTFDRERIPR